MQKQIGAIMLVAGTCIGGGTIALPMVLAQIGIIPSILYMLLMWLIVYSTAIINLELHLQADQSMSLGKLSRKFSGKLAETIANCNFKVLSCALIAVYIYGGSSILTSMFDWHSSAQVMFLFSLFSFLLLLCSTKLVDYINRLLFLVLLAVIAFLIIGLFTEINWNKLPNFSTNLTDIKAWQVLIPIVFTSFGFQGSIPVLVKYCDHNEKILKKAFFWGSFIPAFIYIIWTCSVLSVIYANNESFFQEMISNKVEVGELVKELSNIFQWGSLHILVWWVSLLAIVTSLIGVGIGLSHSIKAMTHEVINHSLTNQIIVSALTILPAYLIAVLVPNAFIKVLGFAGMLLAIIAIFLPIYLLTKIKEKFIIPELKNSVLPVLCLICGIIIIFCEILNML